jgi:hypothetical protein
VKLLGIRVGGLCEFACFGLPYQVVKQSAYTIPLQMNWMFSECIPMISKTGFLSVHMMMNDPYNFIHFLAHSDSQ